MLRNAAEWASLHLWLLRNRKRYRLTSHRVSRALEYIWVSESVVDQVEAATAFLSTHANFLRSRACSNGELIRVGPTSDGGYFVWSPSRFPDIISGGVGDNVDFERELVNLGCSVTVFDHTVSALPGAKFNARFHKRPLGAESSGLSVEDALMVAGTHASKQSLLKLDIEGSEWEFLNSGLEHVVQMGQLIIEFHNMHKLHLKSFRDIADEVFRGLNKNFIIVDIHANNWAPMVVFGNLAVADVFEVTMVNRVLCLEEEINSGPYHYPNNKNRAPIQAGVLHLTPFSE